jgi:hypothetical protein
VIHDRRPGRTSIRRHPHRLTRILALCRGGGACGGSHVPISPSWKGRERAPVGTTATVVTRHSCQNAERGAIFQTGCSLLVLSSAGNHRQQR